jgi:hypothetical protein
LKKLLPCALAAFSLLAFAGCSDRSGSSRRSLDAAVVPGADFSLSIDYGEVRRSPVAGSIRKDAKEGHREYRETKIRELEAATGITRDDLEVILFTADVDDLDLDSSNSPEEAEKIDAVLALALGRAMTPEQLKAGLETLAEDGESATVAEGELRGRPIVSVRPAGVRGGGLFASLSSDGKTVFLTPSRASLEGVLSREEQGRTERYPGPLARVEGELSKESQVKSVLVIPGSLREKLEERFREAEAASLKKPGAAVILSFAAPFRSLTSLSLETEFTEILEISLAADLGGEEQARQAAALLQTLLLPLLKARMAERTGASPADLEGKITVGSAGPRLLITVRLEAEDVGALNL